MRHAGGRTSRVKGFLGDLRSDTGGIVADFKDLRVYRASVDLTAEIYATTAEFPADERFGITQQLRRASTSIGANIAEGTGRATTRELARFIDIARGSAHEVEHFLVLGQRLGYLSPASYDALTAQVRSIQQMLSGLRSKLRARPVGP
jgi:four helix bundle protein